MSHPKVDPSPRFLLWQALDVVLGSFEKENKIVIFSFPLLFKVLNIDV